MQKTLHQGDYNQAYPDALQHPVAVITSQTQNGTSVLALLEMRVNGKTVVAPVTIDGFAFENGTSIDSNAVKSVYGKGGAITNLLASAIQEEQNGNVGVYYIDKNKAAGLLQRGGLQLPTSLFLTDGYIHSIRASASPVNPKFENVTQSQQFKRWFGDWEKNPNTASKVCISRGKEKQRRYRHLLRKKEATDLIPAGVQFPIRIQEAVASNSIIRSFDAKVNRIISDATQSLVRLSMM